jgi:hypothetical protein
MTDGTTPPDHPVPPPAPPPDDTTPRYADPSDPATPASPAEAAEAAGPAEAASSADHASPAEPASLTNLANPASNIVRISLAGLNSTGDPRVDEAVAQLGQLDGAPLEEHPVILGQVHDRLREVLGELSPGDPQRAPGTP